jgi:hypothetical protein
MTTAARTAVTCAMFAAIVALHVLPLPGSPPTQDRPQPAAFIVAVVAVQSWNAAAALAQMLILISPRGEAAAIAERGASSIHTAAASCWELS